MQVERTTNTLPARERTRSVRLLLLSWVVYWVALLAVFAGPKLWRIWQYQRTNTHGTVSISYSGSPMRAVLWIAGPPLLFAAIWLARRPRR